jgi:restriction endonuclease Mrr
MEILKEILGGFDILLVPIFYPVLIIVGVVLSVQIFFGTIIPKLIKTYKNNRSFQAGIQWRSDRDLLQHLQNMSPSDFEEYIAELFNKLGYSARVVGHAGDHGIDVEIEKDGITQYVQCKRYSETNKVGEPEVRNFLGSLDHVHASGKGYFVTTGYFTQDAEKFASDKPIELWDGSELVKQIKSSM